MLTIREGIEKMKMYIATTVDTGDTCDGRARTLGVYLTRKDAKDAVKKDMGGIMDHLVAQGKAYIQGSMSIETADGDMGFLWNIEEKEMKIPEQPKRWKVNCHCFQTWEEAHNAWLKNSNGMDFNSWLFARTIEKEG